MAPLPRPDIAALDETKFALNDRQPFHHTGRFGIARIEFDVAEPSTANLALFIRRARDNYAVYVNGKLAAPTPGILGERSTLHGILPRLVNILPSLLVKGANKLDILSARNATQTALREVYFGPADRLEPAYRHTLTVVHDFGEFTAIAAGTVLLFALALSPLIQRPILMGTVILALALFLMRELYALWVDQTWTQLYRETVLYVIAIWLWLACAAFVNEWTSGPTYLRRQFASAGAAATLVPFVVYAFTGSLDVGYTSAALAQTLIVLVSIALMTTRLTRHYWAAPATTWPEITVASIGFLMGLTLFSTQAVVVPALQTYYTVDSDAFTKLSALSIILFIAIGLARQGVGLHQLATLNNETLSRKVEEKERELAANHARLREQERDRTLTAERGRIMRDVHDGIGSQLLGLLVQTRNGVTEPAAITAGLQAAIDDLYLVIDSLDGVDGSLETALGTFRARITPKCAAAGIDVVWQMHDLPETKSMGPATVLQLYRILQEALSNAIRHGKPKRLTFKFDRDAANNRIELSLKDDGKGFDQAKQTPGRGLTNMKKRAASIGAQLDITSGTGGTTVRLLIPA